MQQRRQTLTRLFLILGIIVFVNIIAVRLFTRFDLTRSKIYTLSDASKKLVKSLDDKFVVKAYYSSDLPSPYNNNRRYLQDQLDEYRAYGGGNFQYEFIDPGKKDDLKQEAQKYGIPPVQVQVVKEDKFQMQEAYMGIVFLYGDKQDRLPLIKDMDNLEYEISSSMKKLTSKQVRKIGFLTGHDEPNLSQFGRLKELLDKQYDVTTVDLSGGKAVPQDVAVLMIVAPEKPFKSWEKFLLDQYLMKGGRIAFLLNEVNANLQNQTGRPVNVDLDDLLRAYGVRVNTDLVRDARCAMVTVSQQAGFFVMQNNIPFPYLPMASEFDKTSPIVKDLSAVVFYFVSSIDTSIARARGLNLDVLIKTSSKSGRQENYFMISPTMPQTKEMFKESGIPLAVTVEGNFTSAFAGTPVVVDSSVKSPLDTTNRITSGKAKIVVVGDGDFLQDQLSGGNKDNIVLASNLVDWLADDIGLASIRSRESTPKPLDEVSEGTKSMVKGINLGLPPLLMIAVGVLRWRWRIAMRKRLENRGF
ncbi:MAG: Gldg family protein [Bacteroidota bacterium]|jgi:gliding-associated putative ABC transporter substrate-binding component GldG